MGIQLNSNNIENNFERFGPVGTMRRRPSSHRMSSLRLLMASSVLFVFELSAFVRNVVEHPNWFQLISRSLNSLVVPILGADHSTDIPDVLVYQWGDGALVFLFFLNLIGLRPAPVRSKVLVLLFVLASLILVHAASIAIFLAKEGTAVSRASQWAIAAPCAILTITIFVGWSRRQP